MFAIDATMTTGMNLWNLTVPDAEKFAFIADIASTWGGCAAVRIS
jgi:hypothetical protein